MRAVISVVGKDRPGILAFVATECANRMINIVDVTQKVLQDLLFRSLVNISLAVIVVQLLIALEAATQIHL